MTLHSVVETIGVLVLGVLVFSYTGRWLPRGSSRPRWGRVLLNGTVFGVLSAALMASRLELAPGISIDARSVPIALIGLVEGWPAAGLAVIPPFAYWLWLGGPASGISPGGAIGAAVAGSLVHLWARRSGGVRLHHALTLSVLVFGGTLAGFAFLGPRGLAAFGRVWALYLLTYVLGIGLLARLLQDLVERDRLAVAAQRFRAVLDEATDAIELLDADTQRILDVNRGVCELTGYAREQLIGRDARELWPPEPGRRAPWEAALADARAHGLARSFALAARTRDGRTVLIDATRRVVIYQGRRYEIVISRGAGDRLAAEAVGREAAELRAATLLARTAAHEINSPLAVVCGYLEFLGRNMPAGSKEATWVRQSRDAALRIQDAVTRLGRVTRLVTAKFGEGAPPVLDTARSSETAPAASGAAGEAGRA